MTTLGSVLVLGSINRDTALHVNAFPLPGETVLATDAASNLGGKGANQAAAARLAGAQVSFLGVVGGDAAGRHLTSELSALGIDTSGIETVERVPSGQARILIDAAGENTIVVLSGANGTLTSERAASMLATHLHADVAVGLAQGELPAAAVDMFAEHLRATGTRFVLNLAPVIDVTTETLALADPLIVNQEESAQLTAKLGIGAATTSDSHATLQGLATVARSVVITLGSRGAIATDGSGTWSVPAPQPVVVADTTGAGDALVGATSAALARGLDLRIALRHGVVAGSIAVETVGTTVAYATRDEIGAHPFILETQV